MLTTIQSSIHSDASLHHEVVCSLSIFVLAVSIVIIIQGDCAHRAPWLR